MIPSVVRRGDALHLWCPACQTDHEITLPEWTWNGDVDRPTVSPSILVRYPTMKPHPLNRCHSFVEGGVWRFLDDCTHHLAGTTVEMATVVPHWPKWLRTG